MKIIIIIIWSIIFCFAINSKGYCQDAIDFLKLNSIEITERTDTNSYVYNVIKDW